MLTESGKFLQIDNEKLEKIKFYIQNSKSKNSQRGYASDWKHIEITLDKIELKGAE